MKKMLAAACSVLFLSCGYFEQDGTKSEDFIVGKFKVSQQENTETTQLSYSDTPTMSTGIIENCREVIYDGQHNMILVENALTENTSDYYKIAILDANAEVSYKAYSKTELSKEAYQEMTANCTACKTILKKANP